MRTRRRKVLLRAGLGLFAVAVLLQLVPYGRDHTNPPVTQDAPWPDGRARELATASCYDCHSNQTRWPLQTFVAPFSWMTARDVEQGRDKLNFSTWDQDDGEADDAADAVADATMPPRPPRRRPERRRAPDPGRRPGGDGPRPRRRRRRGPQRARRRLAAGAEAGQEGLELVPGGGPAAGR